MKVSGQLHAWAALPPNTHCVGDWVVLIEDIKYHINSYRYSKLDKLETQTSIKLCA